MFVVPCAGSLNSGTTFAQHWHNIAWKQWGKESFISSFQVGKTLGKVLYGKESRLFILSLIVAFNFVRKIWTHKIATRWIFRYSSFAQPRQSARIMGTCDMVIVWAIRYFARNIPGVCVHAVSHRGKNISSFQHRTWHELLNAQCLLSLNGWRAIQRRNEWHGQQFHSDSEAKCTDLIKSINQSYWKLQQQPRQHQLKQQQQQLPFITVFGATGKENSEN